MDGCVQSLGIEIGEDSPGGKPLRIGQPVELVAPIKTAQPANLRLAKNAFPVKQYDVFIQNSLLYFQFFPCIRGNISRSALHLANILLLVGWHSESAIHP